MRFELKSGKLLVTDIQDNERGRLARIEIAILKEIGHIISDPIIEGSTTLTFHQSYTPTVREVLVEFMIEV